MQEDLERKLRQLKEGDMVTVTYFILQKRMGDYEIGSYISESGPVEEIDGLGHALVLPQCYVPFTDIYDLQSEVWGHAEGEQA